MIQYNEIKAKYPNAILLFRVGDFYETFGDDAILVSKILNITLTKRANGSAATIELAGFPHHSLENYMPKLVWAGYRVAVCDQLEDPATAKGIVKRGVTELNSPGVAYNDAILNHKSNNFLAAISWSKKQIGIALLDISTGEFFIAQGSTDYISKLIQSFNPSEIIFSKENSKDIEPLIINNKKSIQHLDSWVFGYDYANEILLKHFNTSSLKGFGIDHNLLHFGIIAAGACLHYIFSAEHRKVNHINKISKLDEENYVWLDRFTIRNLELLYSFNENGSSLIDILDYTQSPMGARLLKKWVVMPMNRIENITYRQDIVSFFVNNEEFLNNICSLIYNIGDLERLISKVALQKVNPKELLQLAKSLEFAEEIKTKLSNSGNDTINKLSNNINPSKELRDIINRTINENAPAVIQKGGVIANGFDQELDRLRNIAFQGKDFIADLQNKEAINTGITSLKVGFSGVHGYYLEVTHTHKDKVPDSWIRKQTLTGAERYITPELKKFEEEVIGAEDKIAVIEKNIYLNLLNDIVKYVNEVQHSAQNIATLDVLTNFAAVSIKNNYCKPVFTEQNIIDIKDSRHPIIEKKLPIGDVFIPNDIYLDDKEQQVIIITGPNMAGKSALLRQTALIVLMAQMGSFVPASSALLGITDKVFTRVGASDNISSGESTFMVEMNETASILNNISSRSLVILDEIGRGTSTYDGVSIAWAVTEFIHENKCKAKTLFATHYHELNEMQNLFSRIKNFNVSIKEIDGKIIFLRKLIKGGSEHSFGIHVARLAGMPKSVVANAEVILKKLEESHQTKDNKDTLTQVKKSKNTATDNYQLNIFSMNDPIIMKIRDMLMEIDVNTLTPVEALIKLNEIQKMIK